MFKPRSWIFVLFAFFVLLFIGNLQAIAAQAPELKFDHNHTFKEVVDYLNGMVKAYPKLARVHTIGKSYLDNDLMVIVISNEDTGKCKDKPGYWFDGNLHASEVMGAEVCLHTIHTLLTLIPDDGDAWAEGCELFKSWGVKVVGVSPGGFASNEGISLLLELRLTLLQ